MKHVCLVTLVILAILASAGAAVPPAQQGGAPIKIGAIYNLTGGMASLDVPSANGAKLAAKEINDAGGILGRKLDLVTYDGKTDAAPSEMQPPSSFESDKVKTMLGFSDTDMTLAAAPIAAKAGIPFVTSGATSPKLPDSVPTYLYLAGFRRQCPGSRGGRVLLQYLKAKDSLSPDDKGMEYTLLARQVLQGALHRAGGQSSWKTPIKEATRTSQRRSPSSKDLPPADIVSSPLVPTTLACSSSSSVMRA